MLQKNTRGEELMRVFETIVHGNEQDLMQENANVDGRSPMGVMGTFASESAKYYRRGKFIVRSSEKSDK